MLLKEALLQKVILQKEEVREKSPAPISLECTGHILCKQ